ncbi:MAG: polyphenol oxidase family protein [Candidatus Hydrogenedentes bacterium]|nr:polyphenol oxidase family protein [Candidatus Hydrogenedentota bacterium]
MLWFNSLHEQGASIAVMSDLSDGDCRLSTDEGAAARQRFCEACGVAFEHVTVGNQVHGSRIAVVEATDRGRGHHGSRPAFADTDGLITDVTGLPLGISVADCVPVFLLDSKRRAIGLVHAGRAGTQHAIAATAVDAMREAFATNPENLHAVIGPSAGPDVYEVSEEIAAEFAAAGCPVRGCMLDLWEANARQLIACGVPRTNIAITGVCTITGGRFHSHRAHANGARNLALLML